MTDDVALRPVIDADFEFGYRVKKESVGPYIAESRGWNEDKEKDTYRREFGVDKAQVITFGDTDVGWFINRRILEGQELHQLFILPEYQGRGIGSNLIREVIRAAERQALPVLLMVLKCNHRAKKLYDRFGFKVYSQTDTHFFMRREVQQRIGD